MGEGPLRADRTRANYELWNEGTLSTSDWVGRCFAEDCRWDTVPDLPDSETYVGRAAIADMIESSLIANLGRFRCDIEEVFETGDSVVAAFHLIGEGQIGGVPVDLLVFHVHDLAGDEWIRCSAFLDRDAAVAAAS